MGIMLMFIKRSSDSFITFRNGNWVILDLNTKKMPDLSGPNALK